MRTSTFFMTIYFFMTITGCSKTEQPSNLSPKLVWKVPLRDGLECFSFNPILYNDFVIYGVNYARLDRAERSSIVAYNKSTGARQWEWNELSNNSGSFDGKMSTYTYQNILVVAQKAQVYAIDMNTGKSIWTTQGPEWGHNDITGIRNTIYHVRANFDKKKNILCKADILTGNWKPIFIAEQKNKVSGIGSGLLTDTDTAGKIFLYFTYSYVNLEYTDSETHLVKMDTQTDSIVYNKIVPDEKGFTLSAIDMSNLYLTGGALIACDKDSGKFVRQYLLPQPANYATGRCIVSENKVFAPTNFPKFICYSKESGNILWTEDGLSTSSSSRLLYHDGVVYYTSGGDGNLHAIDENGKRVWRFQSPDRKAPGNGIFDEPITIDKKENRIYLSTFYNACCYETVKK